MAPVTSCLLSKHPLDLIVRVMKFRMTDATAGRPDGAGGGTRLRPVDLRGTSSRCESHGGCTSSEPPPDHKRRVRNARPLEPPGLRGDQLRAWAYERHMREYQTAEAASGRTHSQGAAPRRASPCGWAMMRKARDESRFMSCNATSATARSWEEACERLGARVGSPARSRRIARWICDIGDASFAAYFDRQRQKERKRNVNLVRMMQRESSMLVSRL